MKKNRIQFRNRMLLMVAGLLGVIAFFALSAVSVEASTIATVLATAPVFAKLGKDDEDALVKKMKDEVNAEFARLIDLNEDIKSAKAIAKKLQKVSENATEEELTQIKKDITELGLSLKSMKEKEMKDVPTMSLADSIVNGFKSIKAEDIQAIKEGGKKYKFTVKSAGTMTTSNVTPAVANSAPYSLTEFDASLTRISRRNPFLAQLMNVARTAKMYVAWIEQQNPDGGAGTTSQGSAKTQQDFDLVEATKKVEKITSYIKVSKEMLDDIPFMEAEIRSSLIELVMLKLDSQLLSGTGTTPQLKGILNYAQTFSAGTFANSVDYATRWDVLAVAYNQIVTASGGDSNYSANFVPNFIVLHPSDATALELTKNQDGAFLLPPFVSQNGLNFKGCQVIINSGMTEGDFLIGDFTKSNLRIREDVTVSVGLESDDFTKNLVTILAELRAVHYVKSNHTNAFVTGTFSTAVAALKNAKS